MLKIFWCDRLYIIHLVKFKSKMNIEERNHCK